MFSPHVIILGISCCCISCVDNRTKTQQLVSALESTMSENGSSNLSNRLNQKIAYRDPIQAASGEVANSLSRSLLKLLKFDLIDARVKEFYTNKVAEILVINQGFSQGLAYYATISPMDPAQGFAHEKRVRWRFYIYKMSCLAQEIKALVTDQH